MCVGRLWVCLGNVLVDGWLVDACVCLGERDVCACVGSL